MKQATSSQKPPIYELMIELEDVAPRVWRRFRLDPLCALPLLHLILQRIMGWQEKHAHCFRTDAKQFGPVDDDSRDLWLDERRYRLASLVRDPGDTFEYMYDFGDNWRHRIVLERTLERSRSVLHPKCVGGENACPPEDVGGPPGYARLKFVLQNPDVKEHEEMREWAGDHFDPTRFDVEYQNRSLWDVRGTKLPAWAR